MSISNRKSNKRAKDPFDKLIFEDKLRAKQLLIDKDLDLMVVIFNNGKLIKLRISDCPALKNASKKQLENWRFIGAGIGIRWEMLNEDLSIKGIIKTSALNNALRNLHGIGGDEKIVA